MQYYAKLMVDDSFLKLYFLATCFLELCLHIKSEVDITDVQSDLIEAPLGTNNVLVCNLIYKNEMPIKPNIYQIKTSYSSKLPVRILTRGNSTVLELRKLNLENTGYYTCVISKDDVSEDIHLKVSNDISKPSNTIDKFDSTLLKKIKRDDYSFDNIIPVYTYPPRTEQARVNLKKNVEEYLKAQQDADELYRNSKNIRTPPLEPLNSYLLPFAVPLCFGFIWAIICCCGGTRDDNDNKNGGSRPSSRRSRHSSERNSNLPYNFSSNNLNRCGHESCIRNYLLNPSGACRYVEQPSAPIDSLFTIPIGFRINESSPRARNLDLSPSAFTYPGIDVPTISTSNRAAFPTTDLDLPPSYKTTVNSLPETGDRANARVLDAQNDEDVSLPPSYTDAVTSKYVTQRESISHNRESTTEE